MTKHDISIKNLSVDFRDKLRLIRAVDNVDINFQSGKITGIVGESGSGKSVLGMSILKLLPSNAIISGECIYGNNDLYKLTGDEIRNIRCKEIGLIVQNPFKSLNPVLTIGRQLREPLMKHLGKSKEESKKIVLDYLKKFGFENPQEIYIKYPFQLSGGMNQRIISIMGLICHPKWIIADEPTKGLDSILRKNVYDVFFNIKENYTGSMVIITHDLYFAKKICDVIVVMYSGEIVEVGRADEILLSPKHPYTRGLIKASPSKGMFPIPDNINNIDEIGCKFSKRCPEFNGKCQCSQIKLKKISGHSMVRCALYD